MTDSAAYPSHTLLGHQHASASLPHPNGSLQPTPPPLRFGAAPAVVEAALEDDGQISCECGYPDDDGATVACDSCNRWQHQLCYYPQFEDQPLPDDLQHYCIDCRPRPFDSAAAAARQKVKRDEQALLANGGVRRPASKSHKKKVKEPAYTNGWPLDKSRHDRNSASPRDQLPPPPQQQQQQQQSQPQPPPAKRPKTSHRASDSTSGTTGRSTGHARKRTASNINHHNNNNSNNINSTTNNNNINSRRRSLSRSPDSSVHLYSPEFVQRYRDDSWADASNNLHDSIAISNSLSEWLTLPDDEFREMHGHNKAEVLMRWDGELDDIPGRAELEVQEVTDDRVTEGPLAYPSWKTLTVKEPVASGGYIGELKGHVGFKEEYLQDPANRWALLRHPEPFVFFHPKLPIYIDARSEGTQLRYVRRSCSPNATLQVLVTNQKDYRFCFMATQQIEPGMEIAVPWDTANGFLQHGHNGADLDLGHLSAWVSRVLADCGPCACRASEADCYMARFDRRIVPGDAEKQAAQPMKATKSKSRKSRANISPPNTYANSRSGSEARKVDGDDEPTDSRSVSGSAVGRDSMSRDMTPNTHYSLTGSLTAPANTAPELSERERKKLAKEEEMFRRQEEQLLSAHGRQSKKKRNSGGATGLMTPNASSGTSTKQLGHGSAALDKAKYADAGTARQAGLPASGSGGGGSAVKSVQIASSAASAAAAAAAATTMPTTSLTTTGIASTGPPGRRAKRSATPRTQGKSTVESKPVVAPRRAPRAHYVDASVQCDMDSPPPKPDPADLAYRSRPFLSLTQRLLRRCAVNNSKRKLSAAFDDDPKPQSGQDVDMADAQQPKTDAEETSPRVAKAARISPERSAQPTAVQVSKPPVDETDPEPTPSSDTLQGDAESVVRSEQDAAPDVEMTKTPELADGTTDAKAKDVDDDQDIKLAQATKTDGDHDGPSPHLPTSPDAPPWPSQLSHSSQPNGPDLSDGSDDAQDAKAASAQSHRPTEMHLDMPPPPAPPPLMSVQTTEPPQTPSSDAAANTQTVSNAEIVQSPSGIANVTTSIDSTTSKMTSSATDLGTTAAPPSTAATTPAAPVAAPAATPAPAPAPTPSPLAITTAPPTNAPLFSPSVKAAIAPSPARKKLSLSDYTRRSKAKDHKDSDSTTAGSAGAGPTGLVNSIGVGSGLGAESAESTSAIIDDDERDVKMEDAVDAVAAAPGVMIAGAAGTARADNSPQADPGQSTSAVVDGGTGNAAAPAPGGTSYASASAATAGVGNVVASSADGDARDVAVEGEPPAAMAA